MAFINVFINFSLDTFMTFKMVIFFPENLHFLMTFFLLQISSEFYCSTESSFLFYQQQNKKIIRKPNISNKKSQKKTTRIKWFSFSLRKNILRSVSSSKRLLMQKRVLMMKKRWFCIKVDWEELGQWFLTFFCPWTPES